MRLEIRRRQGLTDVAPPVLQPVLPPVRIYKADLWRRATDAEAVTIDQALADQPVRLRRLFDDATFLDPTDPEFAAFRAGFIAAFGEARAAELLAPSAIA